MQPESVSVHYWTPMMDSIENESFCRCGWCCGTGAYVVSKAASRFLQRSAAGGAGGGGGGAPRSNSTSANARRLRTRSFQTGSFVNSLSLPVHKLIAFVWILTCWGASTKSFYNLFAKADFNLATTTFTYARESLLKYLHLLRGYVCQSNVYENIQ